MGPEEHTSLPAQETRKPYFQATKTSRAHEHRMEAMSQTRNHFEFDDANTTERVSSSRYSTSDRGFSACSTIASTETQSRRDSYYRKLIAERLDQLLDRLLFLQIRQSTLKRNLPSQSRIARSSPGSCFGLTLLKVPSPYPIQLGRRKKGYPAQLNNRSMM